jgi:hypothetical protein
MLKILPFAVIFSVIVARVNAQDSLKTHDSTHVDGYYHWSKFRPALRVGVGIQKSFFTEIGISAPHYYYSDLGIVCYNYYTTMEWNPTILPRKPDNIYGYKVGGQIQAAYAVFGLETKYQTDFKNKYNFVITPKFGVNLILFTLYYGYGFSLEKNPFKTVLQNQVSLVFDLNRYNRRLSKQLMGL